MKNPQLLVYAAIGIGVLLLIVTLIFIGILPGRREPGPPSATLEFWGVEEDEELWREITLKFREKFPQIEVNYRRFDEERYEDTLVNRLAEGKGPDIFLLKNIWLAKHGDKILPAPQEYLGVTPIEFQRTFADAALEDLVSPTGEILGLPIYIDTLALFYNKDIFNSAGIANPPKNWDEVTSLAQSLSKISGTGDIIKSGIALGDARNIPHAFEILSALIMQNGDSIAERGKAQISLGERAIDALRFYTSFSDQKRTNFSWTARMPNAIEAFAEGRTAMYIGFLKDIQRIRARNPHLNFDVAPLPQPRIKVVPITYAEYFFPTVSNQSKAPLQAWEFILFIASRDGAKMYLEKTGKPAARRDLISEKAPNAILDVFYKQALVAKSWPIPDEKSTRKVFLDAIDSVVSRTASAEQAMSKLREQLRLLLP